MAIEKMVEGRLRKYFEDVVFMDQKFIMNDTMNVKVCGVSVNRNGFICDLCQGGNYDGYIYFINIIIFIDERNENYIHVVVVSVSIGVVFTILCKVMVAANAFIIKKFVNSPCIKL